MNLVPKQMLPKELNICILLIAFTICYLLMIISILAGMWDYNHLIRSSIYAYIINLLFGLTAVAETFLFTFMLIKLFIEPDTHKLTSFLGLIIGELFCIFLYYFIFIGYAFLNLGTDYFFVFLYIIVFPFLGCVAYGMLIIVKALRCLFYFALK